MENNLKKIYIYISFAVHLKLTQHCKLYFKASKERKRERERKKENTYFFL